MQGRVPTDAVLISQTRSRHIRGVYVPPGVRGRAHAKAGTVRKKGEKPILPQCSFSLVHEAHSSRAPRDVTGSMTPGRSPRIHRRGLPKHRLHLSSRARGAGWRPCEPAPRCRGTSRSPPPLDPTAGLVLLERLHIRAGVGLNDIATRTHRQPASHAWSVTVSRAFLGEARPAFRGQFP